jgi:glutaredoxin 2
MTDRLTIVIAGLTKLADATNTNGVGYRGEDKTEKVTPMTLLQDNTDEFVALIQDLPAKADIRENIAHFDQAAHGIEQYLTKISSDLKEILEPGNDTKEVAKIKATSGLNEFADQLEQYAKNFSDLVELSSTMKKLSMKHREQEKHQPVKHKLRNKQEIKAPPPPVQDTSIDALINKKP